MLSILLRGGGDSRVETSMMRECKKCLYGQTSQRTKSRYRSCGCMHAARASKLVSRFRKEPNDVLFFARLEHLFWCFWFGIFFCEQQRSSFVDGSRMRLSKNLSTVFKHTFWRIHVTSGSRVVDGFFWGRSEMPKTPLTQEDWFPGLRYNGFNDDGDIAYFDLYVYNSYGNYDDCVCTLSS